MTSRLQQEGFRARVTRILQAWADWAVYPTDFLLHINDVFLGQDKVTILLPFPSPCHVAIVNNKLYPIFLSLRYLRKDRNTLMYPAKLLDRKLTDPKKYHDIFQSE